MQFLHCCARRIRVGQVKMNRGRPAAGGHDLADDCIRGRNAAMRMYIHEVTGDAEAPADGGSDAAAAARDQGPSRFVSCFYAVRSI